MEFKKVKSHKRKLSDTRSVLPRHAQQNIENLFEKKFVYKTSADFCIPHVDAQSTVTDFWTIESFVKMKDELNTLKDNLNDKDMISWHEHTRIVNLAGSIAPELRNRLRPELCTQAWCKFYEIACTFLNMEYREPFFSVHLCEAPGAFLTSLNHYLFTIDYKGDWDWLATTLNPYYEGNHIGEMIDEDGFISCTYNNWYFGEDGTGNLMLPHNLSGLKSRLNDVHVNLVTADGSIDCQFDPAEQENVVSQLHHCEVITALHILAPGGTFVVKMFTLLEGRSVCLVYLLNCLFRKVTIFKPCTSKGGNSEVYVVCQDYKGRQSCEQLLAVITPWYFGQEGPNGCMFPLSAIPAQFLKQHTECVQIFKDFQMSAIQRNLDLYPQKRSRSHKVTEKGDSGDLQKPSTGLGSFASKQVQNIDRDTERRTLPDKHNVEGQMERSRSRYDKVMPEEERSRLDQEKEYCLECFLTRYDVKPLHNSARIMKLPKSVRQLRKVRRQFAEQLHLDGKFTGTFQERQVLATLPWQQRMLSMETYEAEVDREDNSLWLQCGSGSMTESVISQFQPSIGQRICEIRSSRFCPGFYLSETHHILHNVKWLSDQQEISPQLRDSIVQSLTRTLLEALKYNTDISHESRDQDLGYRSKPEVNSNSQSNNTTCNHPSDNPGLCKNCKSSSEVQNDTKGKICKGSSKVENDSKDKNRKGSFEVQNDSKGKNYITTEDVNPTNGEKDANNLHREKMQIDCSAAESLSCDQKHLQDAEEQGGFTDHENENKGSEIDNAVENMCTDTSEKESCIRSNENARFDCKYMHQVCVSYRSEVLEEMERQTRMVPQLEMTGEVPEVLLYCASSDCVTERFELMEQPTLYNTVLDILQKCKVGQSVIVEIGLCLTRLTAGLVYCLYRTFREIGFVHNHGQLMKRHLVCVDFQHCPIMLLQYLQETSHMVLIDQSESLLEIIPVLHIKEDHEFTQFLEISNTNLLQSFITSVVNKERQLLHNEQS